MKAHDMVPVMEPGDMETIHQKLDFYGLNFYNGLIDNADEILQKEKEKHQEGGNYQDRPEVHTEKLVDVLHMLKEKYKVDIPILITENGVPQTDSPDVDSLLADDERITYIEGVLKALHQAIAEGANVIGYTLWSLMDNFEWSAGCEARYGLCYTDYQTKERIPKKSFHWYANVIRENGFDA
jgi:beta-glucosidase